MKTKTAIIVLTVGIFTIIAAFVYQQKGDWKAPSSANQLKNPYKNNVSATNEGKKLYKQMCAICHGNSGKGNGMAGISLNPRPSNFTTEKVQS